MDCTVHSVYTHTRSSISNYWLAHSGEVLAAHSRGLRLGSKPGKVLHFVWTKTLDSVIPGTYIVKYPIRGTFGLKDKALIVNCKATFFHLLYLENWPTFT